MTEERPLLDESSDDDLDVGKVSPMKDDIEEDEVEKGDLQLIKVTPLSHFKGAACIKIHCASLLC